MTGTLPSGDRRTSNDDVDIWADFNSTDDTGLPWTLLDEAAEPSRIVPGAFVLAGSEHARAVAEVVDVGDDGVVHLRPLPGLVARHAHLLRAAAR